MDILKKLAESSMDIATTVPHNINIYFDTLRTDEENEKLQEQATKLAEEHARITAEKYLENLKELNSAADKENNAVLIPNSKGIPFVDLIF
jgi:hypothetical protein